MGYIVKQLMLSGLESAGGHNIAVVEVDAVADFSALPAFQDGSVGFIRGNPDALYVKDTTWKQVSKSALAEGAQAEIDGVSPYTLAMVFKLLQGKLALLTETAATADALDVLTTKGDLLVQGAAAPEALAIGTSNKVLSVTAGMPVWADPKDLVFVQDTMPEYVRASIPTTQSGMFEGMIVYNTTDHTLKCCTTPGEQEVDTLTVTAGAGTTAGDITITLNSEAITVAVAKDDDEEAVAAKIKTAVEAAVAAKTIAAWTVAIDGAELVFTKGAVGTAEAPTAVDTGDTGCTFSAFARTNEGVASVWGVLINAG